LNNSLYFQRLPLFPQTTGLVTTGNSSRLQVAGLDLAELAQRYGTPLYLYDQTTLDVNLQDYQEALQRYYPASSGVTYAGKAFLCLAMAQWVHTKQLQLDCSGAGEIYLAVKAQLPRENILVHGVNKSDRDLQAALEEAGIVVVDNLVELERICRLATLRKGPVPDLWLRYRPGLAVDTHSFTQTGQHDSKFGMDGEEIHRAVRLCLHSNLHLTGLHFHQGSQFHDPGPLAPAIQSALDLLSSLKADTGWYPQVFCPGGGWGVAYHEDDLPHPSVENYVAFVAGQVVKGCTERNLALPHLQLEPGRSLVAQAGLVIYRVGAVKTTPGRRWLLLDGGLADNPRPTLYRTRYSALPIANSQRPANDSAWLAGPYCESGDILIESLPLPEIQVGEWLAVPMSGAYQISMSSNYNGACRPAVLWLENGQEKLIMRRETLDDLLRRDLPLQRS
jgi:diaminopimelate decarboxylase